MVIVRSNGMNGSSALNTTGQPDLQYQVTGPEERTAEVNTLPERATYRTGVRPGGWDEHHDVAAKNAAKRRASMSSHDLATQKTR